MGGGGGRRARVLVAVVGGFGVPELVFVHVLPLEGGLALCVCALACCGGAFGTDARCWLSLLVSVARRARSLGPCTAVTPGSNQ